ncbi:DUF397 domain-containing protein [Paractinoplanes rishiriensis]|uniref:DUF397 domain-containing protein n=1 Tax=Paractinoplanes rishiriensis TaxID=1050105 RepID=A0A919JW14_9ACTN|nr:DUF397 domain-containing protein [Actinoplanes rishiriensis]GIE95878.1 hypothetical protein Ari01nite_33430 [Actinoplanes rishiriensis]
MPTDHQSPAGAAWRRSRFCVGESNCVEVADLDGLVGLRNSRKPALTLTFTKSEWSNFLAALKSGEIQLSGPR